MLKKSLLNSKTLQEKKDQNLSPNFLNSVVDSGHSLKFSQLASLLKLSIASLYILFIALFAFNFYVSRQLSKIEASAGELTRLEADYSGVREKAFNIIKKVETYKNLSSQRKLISENVLFVFNQTPAYVTLEDIRFKGDSALILASASSPVHFSYLVSKYLESEEVQSITLQTAALDDNSQKFLVKLEVEFK